jgi:hypothetical protein
MRSLKLAALALLIPAALAAQQHQHAGQQPAAAMQGQGMGMKGGMLGAIMPFAPDNLLKMSSQLGLTADQVTRLTALRDATAKAADDAHHPAMQAHMGLNKTMKESPEDTVAIRQYFLAHATAESNMQWIRASAAFQARAMLTEAQRGMVK